MKKIISILASCIIMQVNAQTNSDTTILQSVVVSGTKFAEKQKNVVQKIDVINAKQIASTNAPSTGDLLMQSGHVFVQKSQLGGSSPVIRGFEASRILLVVDGVRLNNAIYRSGHLQNVITLDQSMLESIEIINGPASTLFGSDALGGLLNFNSKRAMLNTNPSFGITSKNAYLRYSSAAAEKTMHVDFGIANNKLGFLTSFTVSDFGNLRAGANRSSAWDSVGLRKFYVQTFNGADSMVKNNNFQNQVGSHYKQYDFLEKINFKQSNQLQHILNIQFSTTSNVQRYDRLTDATSGGVLKNAEWYYGPQKRFLASYVAEFRNLNKLIQEANINVNYQNIEESRNTRGYRKPSRTQRVENLDIIGFDAHAKNNYKKNEFIIGIDGQFNNIKSTSTQIFVANDSIAPATTRYPDGRNIMNLAGIYVQDVFKIIPNKWILNAGLRAGVVYLSSSSSTNIFYKAPFAPIIQTNSAITGNIGINYLPTAQMKLNIGISTAFKAPNIDEIGKVAESAKSTFVVVTNRDLKPEQTTNFDVGVTFAKSRFMTLQFNGFYTLLTNAMIYDRVKYNGNDSILFDGANTQVVALTNKGAGKIYGFTISSDVNLAKNLLLSAKVSYTKGTYDPGNSFNYGLKVVPLDHIPPVFGKIGVQYNMQKWNVEFYSLFNGAKKLVDYNPLSFGEDNLQYATANGTPAWATINIKGAYNFTKNIALQLGLENILDTHYRQFASGISAPGTNAIIALRAKL